MPKEDDYNLPEMRPDSIAGGETGGGMLEPVIDMALRLSKSRLPGGPCH